MKNKANKWLSVQTIETIESMQSLSESLSPEFNYFIGYK